MAGKRLRMNNNGAVDKQWWSMDEDNGSCLDRVEDWLRHGRGGSTAFFCFLTGLNSTSNSTLTNPAQNLGYFSFFGGGRIGQDLR